MLSGKLQLILIIAIVLYFIFILILLKRKELNLKYSLLWIFSGICMAVLVAFPKGLLLLVGLIGIQTPMYGLLFLGLVFVLVILMSLTSIVSRQNRKIRSLIQDNALLEERLRRIESKER